MGTESDKESESTEDQLGEASTLVEISVEVEPFVIVRGTAQNPLLSTIS